MKNRPFPHRLGFALTGMRTVWRRERSFRTHVGLGGAAMLMLFVLQPDWIWIGVLALAIASVLALEMFNSALEYLIDHVHPALAVEIGHAKDAAAGAVLIASIAALAVGLAMLASAIIR